MRAWVVDLSTTHYIIGSAIGPHPFPTIVRTFQSVIGNETKVQMQGLKGKLPDAVIACVGGGSNAAGMFYPFSQDPSVKLLGVEAGGDGDTLPHPLHYPLPSFLARSVSQPSSTSCILTIFSIAGIDTPRHSATLTAGTKGVLHGVKTYILQNAHGQITDTHSVRRPLPLPPSPLPISTSPAQLLHRSPFAIEN